MIAPNAIRLRQESEDLTKYMKGIYIYIEARYKAAHPTCELAPIGAAGGSHPVCILAVTGNK